MNKLITIVRQILLEEQSDNILRIARNPNGLISPTGKIIPLSGETNHVNWLVKNISKYKKFEKGLKQANDDNWHLLYKLISDEAFINAHGVLIAFL